MRKKYRKNIDLYRIPKPLILEDKNHKLKLLTIASCIISLFVSLFAIHVETQSELQKLCNSVTYDFTSIMESYNHSFCLFEKILQQEIKHSENADEIEVFLKEQDKQLLEIEGGDYDGVYMYYDGRYLYSWDTPYSVYRDSGYDATSRPWYKGAVGANGKVFFSTPYPSYANDYMLATISRLQSDGETVIAYDIKLGEIGKFVDKLDIYNGSLTLICDSKGNIIGSTNHLYQGGNYMFSEDKLEQNIEDARNELDNADTESAELKAEDKLKSAEAQKRFCIKDSEYLIRLLNNSGSLVYRLSDYSFGYAYSNDTYTCFVIVPCLKLLQNTITVWAALSFIIILISIMISKLLGRNNQILTDVLTGLNNRRAFLKFCDNHILHHAHEDFCLIILDLNEFKKINDKYGHIAGDHALLDTANALREACAEAPCNFFLCRYGGDEFLLAGDNCTSDNIEKSKALILKKLSLKNQSGINPYTLEASIGVSNGKCTDKNSLEDLLEKADKAMYEEKILSRQTGGRSDR